MWRLNQEVVKKVKESLEEIGGICPRCLLRCAGVKNSGIIREAGLEKEAEPEKKRQKLDPCRLCLGRIHI